MLYQRFRKLLKKIVYQPSGIRLPNKKQYIYIYIYIYIIAKYLSQCYINV